jgi:hypothetical protein
MTNQEENFSDYVSETEAPIAEAEKDQDWENKYKSEVQDRIKERERYKPMRQIFDNIDPSDAEAIQGFAQAWARGDQETAINWMIDNAKTLAGDSFYELAGVNSEGQTVLDVIDSAQEEASDAGLTPSQVNKLVEERMNQFQYDRNVEFHENQISETLQNAGYDPNSPLAIAAITAAQRREDLDLDAAIAEIENDILKRAQSIVQKRKSPSAGMPTAGPNGIAGKALSASATPREKAMARLEQNNS